MFAIEVQSIFNASHALRLPGGDIEPKHAHTFKVIAKLTTPQLDAIDTVIDFHLVEKILVQLLRPWQYKHLNDLEPFKSKHNPSAERIAQQIGEELQAALAALPDPAAKSVQVVEIRLTEAPDCLAIWSPN